MLEARTLHLLISFEEATEEGTCAAPARQVCRAASRPPPQPDLHIPPPTHGSGGGDDIRHLARCLMEPMLPFRLSPAAGVTELVLNRLCAPFRK